MTHSAGEFSRHPRGGIVRGLIPIGILLVIAWVVGFVVFKVAGILIHLLIFAGIIMLIVGFFRRVSGDV
jgi:Family of unknown function (DUF5670)